MLSLVVINPSNVPLRQSASGTSGHAVVFGMAPKNRVRQACPAPPELRSFSPFRLASESSGDLAAEYQLWNPSSSH